MPQLNSRRAQNFKNTEHLDLFFSAPPSSGRVDSSHFEFKMIGHSTPTSYSAPSFYF
jgi:hypothetical protein